MENTIILQKSKYYIKTMFLNDFLATDIRHIDGKQGEEIKQVHENTITVFTKKTSCAMFVEIVIQVKNMHNKKVEVLEMKKLTALLISCVLLMSALAGCGGTASTKPSNSTSPSQSAPAETPKDSQKPAVDFKVGIIFTEAGLGGQSFNDLVYQGVVRAKDELGIQFDYVEPKSVSDEEIVQDEMAASEEYGIIICVGAEQKDALTRVAANYPNQKFALIDATIEMDNVACYTSKEQEGSFLAGALAALLKNEKASKLVSDSKVVGIMCGVDNPLLNRFAAGFTAGAKIVDPEYTVLVDYVGGFNDPTTAKNIATTFKGKGADVIFHAAGASGMGLFQAAEENGFMAIGVNLNQNTVAPNNIVASMMKRVDSSAYHAVESAMNGSFKAGIKVMGLADQGVDLDFEGSHIVVPDSIVTKLNDLKEKVVSGELVVPESMDQVDSFLASAN
jgi:basic membrane protein A